jgi:hypothetical protein
LIVSGQFSATGNLPWFITNIPGEIYIKKDWVGIFHVTPALNSAYFYLKSNF